MILTDSLIDRIHAAQIETLRLFAEGYARLRPDATAGPLGTGYALYAGEGSPLTQCYGFAHRVAGDIAEIESFYTPRTEDWEVTLTPFTDGDTARAFFAAGYRFVDFEGMLAQTVDEPSEVRYEIIEVGSDTETFLETSARAWQAEESGPVEISEFSRAAAMSSARQYLAFVDGVPAAAASMIEAGDTVLLAGGATRVPYRGQGLQTALIARRLRDAGRGRLALMGAVPGSASHRNAQRAGFTPLYSTAILKKR